MMGVQSLCSRIVGNGELEKAPLQDSSMDILLDTLDEFMPSNKLTRRRSPHSATVIRLVRSVLERHEITFHALMVQLGEMNSTSGYSTFVAVADQLFEGGVITWGRIIVLLAFGVRLSIKLCKTNHTSSERIKSKTDSGKNGRKSSISPDVAAGYIGSYIAEKVAPWIQQNGGWAMIDEKFPQQEDPKDTSLWRSLIITGIGVGIATAATAALTVMH